MIGDGEPDMREVPAKLLKKLGIENGAQITTWVTSLRQAIAFHRASPLATGVGLKWAVIVQDFDEVRSGNA